MKCISLKKVKMGSILNFIHLGIKLMRIIIHQCGGMRDDKKN